MSFPNLKTFATLSPIPGFVDLAEAAPSPRAMWPAAAGGAQGAGRRRSAVAKGGKGWLKQTLSIDRLGSR